MLRYVDSAAVGTSVEDRLAPATLDHLPSARPSTVRSPLPGSRDSANLAVPDRIDAPFTVPFTHRVRFTPRRPEPHRRRRADRRAGRRGRVGRPGVGRRRVGVWTPPPGWAGRLRDLAARHPPGRRPDRRAHAGRWRGDQERPRPAAARATGHPRRERRPPQLRAGHRRRGVPRRGRLRRSRRPPRRAAGPPAHHRHGPGRQRHRREERRQLFRPQELGRLLRRPLGRHQRRGPALDPGRPRLAVRLLRGREGVVVEGTRLLRPDLRRCRPHHPPGRRRRRAGHPPAAPTGT